MESRRVFWAEHPTYLRRLWWVWKDRVAKDQRGIGTEAIAVIRERGADGLDPGTRGGGDKTTRNPVISPTYDHQEHVRSRNGTCEKEMKEGQHRGRPSETTGEESCRRSERGGKTRNSVPDILTRRCKQSWCSSHPDSFLNKGSCLFEMETPIYPSEMSGYQGHSHSWREFLPHPWLEGPRVIFTHHPPRCNKNREDAEWPSFLVRRS